MSRNNFNLTYGCYSCPCRNSSFCVEVTMSLNVIKKNEVRYDIAYEQIAFEQSSYHMFCPDISDFIENDSNVHLQWFKGEESLENKIKYKYSDGTKYIHITEVMKDDEGYYKCELQFTHQNKEYAITRIIHLQTVGQLKRDHPVITYPNHKPITATLGSKLLIPCKVYTGNEKNAPVVWWLANDSFIDILFEDGRVIEGTFQETTESDGHYIEVSLIFENVKEEDFNTEYKCIARNDYGSQVLPTQIKRA
ncbi:hypothetical protein GDO86_003874, partial [Hymenochirus boettgeri]